MYNTCRICKEENNSEKYILKEMMYGSQEEFEYFMCRNCGCLQINEFPKDIKKYYPKDYLPPVRYSKIKNYFRKQREIFALSGKNILGHLMTLVYGYPFEYSWFYASGLKKNDSILEVGSGKGDLLKLLYTAGFNNLLGIDPFFENELFDNSNIRIFKKDITQIDGKFDWIMFHHSFEHLSNPHETFKTLKKLINKQGTILIRIPLIDSYAWKKYGTNWVQLDAPRHLFLYTIKSIDYISKLYGFKIKKIVYDSDSLQFWGSEQYKKQIPLMSPKSYFVNHNNSIFSKRQMKEFAKKSTELNGNKNGDKASIFIVPD